MRLIGSFDTEKHAKGFSQFLKQEGLANECDSYTDTDWGSNSYGTIRWRIWIVDEDQVDTANAWLEKFNANPHDPQFTPKTPPLIPNNISFEEIEPSRNTQQQSIKTPRPQLRPRDKWRWEKITLSTLLLCILLFIWSTTTTPNIKRSALPAFFPAMPFFTSPVEKELLYDYPEAYEIVDKLILLYGIEKLQHPWQLPPEGQYLIEKYNHTPYWQGFYNKALHYFKKPRNVDSSLNPPMFEKISQGEVWRLFTPCLLHSDIFHIFFNMFWLIILGNQMEKILGKGRYLLFLLLTGIFSNTAQYFMGGPNFLGFSGVLCAMIAFIYIRQKRAAWEGYQLHSSTIGFIAIFVFSVFALQVASFIFEIFSQKSFSLGIANTGHLSGALIGFLLGKLDFFAWKPKK